MATEASRLILLLVGCRRMALSYEADQVETFQVTFMFDYASVVAGVTGNAGGE